MIPMLRCMRVLTIKINQPHLSNHDVLFNVKYIEQHIVEWLKCLLSDHQTLCYNQQLGIYANRTNIYSCLYSK